MHTDTNDILLWNTFREGDKEALGSLFEKYFEELFRYGSKISLDSDSVKDTIQEIFIEIWNQKAPQPVISVKAYLLKALKYKLLRSSKQNKISGAEIEDLDHGFQLSHEHFLIQSESDKEKAKRLLSALDQLPNRQREIIYLKYYLDLDYDEICEIMSIQYQVARNQVSSSIKTMKKMMTLSAVLFIFFLLMFSKKS